MCSCCCAGFSVDWWALGVLMFEMLAGRSPFDIVGQTDNPDQNTEDYLFQGRLFFLSFSVCVCLSVCLSVVFMVLRQTLLATHPRACQVQSGMSGSPVAVLAGTSLLGRWLRPRVRQHSALSAVSWRSDLHGATNTQLLQRQIFCSHWTSLVKLSSGPAAQYRHHLQTVQTTAEGTSVFRKHENGALWLLIRVALGKHLLTYLLLCFAAQQHLPACDRLPTASVWSHGCEPSLENAPLACRTCCMELTATGHSYCSCV